MPASPVADPFAMTLPREQLPRGGALPVIPRIVRCTTLERDRMIARAVAYAILAVHSAGRSTVGGMIGVALLLAALGASAGVGLRSLAEPAQSSLSASAAPPAAPAVVAATAVQPDESAGPETPAEETPPATEPVARVTVAARTSLPTSRGPRAHGAQRPDPRAPRGRIHPTSARPLARRTTASKSKVP
jgi:hypothetical protein